MKLSCDYYWIEGCMVSLFGSNLLLLRNLYCFLDCFVVGDSHRFSTRGDWFHDAADSVLNGK